MKKVIFFDIDGTLIDTFGDLTDISLNVKAALRLLQSNGHYVFIASGRPYASLSKTILDFGFDGYVLANGAHVMINNETIHSNPIDKTFIKGLVESLDTQGIEYILVDHEHIYVKETTNEINDFYDKIGILSKDFIRDYNIDDLNIHKAEIIIPNENVLNHCKEFVNAHPDYGYFNSIHGSHFELFYKENTKAAGILKALEYLNIPIENTYAFGDGDNDIEMLSLVSCGIAMGNASDEVKKYANEITDTVINDGVAAGIKKYILDSI